MDGSTTVVGEAGTTEQALSVLAATEADVLLVDLEIPTRGGLWLVDRARRTQPALVAIAFSAHAQPSDIRAAFAAGAFGFVAKTQSLSSLRSAISTVAAGGTYLPPELREARFESRPRALSTREAEVLRLIAMGYTNKEVASEIALSIKSVETYRARAMGKLGLVSRRDVFRYAVDTGLLDLHVAR